MINRSKSGHPTCGLCLHSDVTDRTFKKCKLHKVILIDEPWLICNQYEYIFKEESCGENMENFIKLKSYMPLDEFLYGYYPNNRNPESICLFSELKPLKDE